MTDQELLNQQDRLQQRAHLVLDELNLLSVLGKFGNVHLVGSVSFGLMAWPDIDIESHIEEYDIDQMLEVAKSLLDNQQIIDVTLRDYRQDQNPNKPKGLYVGAKYNANGERWKIDIWLLKEKDKQALDITSRLKNLTLEQKLSILKIKNHFWKDERYRKSVISIDIYTAVLDHNTSSIEQFDTFLKRTGR